MTPRKSPVRHAVKRHKRMGKWVAPFYRGQGTPRSKSQKKIVSKVDEIVNLENLTYSEIPKITCNLLGKGKKWILFSGSAAPVKWCYDIEKSLTTTGIPAGISPSKEAVTKKIKDGYVVYHHT